MKVLIVAKTRRGSGACVGAISFRGPSLRLEAADAALDEMAGLEFEVGEVWEVEGQPAAEVIPPHVENFIVSAKRRLAIMDDMTCFITNHMPPVEGSIEQLYNGFLGATRAGALYVSEQLGIPPCSTMFWVPDRPLQLDASAKRLRYCYPTDNGNRTLTFVGFQEPLDVIEPGTLLRVSLAHWWRPKEKPDGELRCYVQLSGWFLPQDDAAEQFAMPLPEAARVPPEPALTPEVARTSLKQIFGFDNFWPLQEEIVNNLLAGRDTLAIMPTGSGKSLCYQLPALLFPGLTVVVSPLISLMQDQVEQLRELDIPAAYLNSSLSYGAYGAMANQVRQGAVKLLYVAPETLLRPETLVLLDDSRVSCLTVDEAHCISSWGHDFRPEYRQLQDVRQRWPEAVCFALTATATARVRSDIQVQLGMTSADMLVASFDRPNLFLAVTAKRDPRRQLDQLLADHRDESGIIYCATKRTVDELAAQLADEGWSVRPYHAGLAAGQRQLNQRQFIYDEVQIMVATIAFGMGINKPNVRFVIHYDVPKNLESYYQQIGRAGRDGLRADCHLLFSFSDVRTIRYFINQSSPDLRPGAVSRLQTLIDFAETSECRRRPLLAYFEEKYPAANCGMCDNCLAASDKENWIDVTEAAQKFLSCVKRTGENFGTSHIIDVLRGSRAKKVLKWNHNHLSTYDIGREYSKREWQALAGKFVQQGLLARDERHGSLKLTYQGKAVLRGQAVRIPPLDIDVSITSKPRLDTDAYDAELFTILREKRQELAKAVGLPAFVIFHDSSLKAMTKSYPQTEADFADVHGVGKAKLKKYAGEFLPLIRNYCAKKENSQESVEPAPAADELSPHIVEAAQAFNNGESISALAERLTVTPETIVYYLWRYAETGRPLPIEKIREQSTLSSNQQAAVMACFDTMGTNRLSRIFHAMHGNVSYDELRVMRLVYIVCQSN
jgi:ATP-dependent DNA helicase RecQ